MNGKGEWGQNHVPRMKLTQPEYQQNSANLPKPETHDSNGHATAKRRNLEKAEGDTYDAFEAQYSRRIKRARTEKKICTESSDTDATNAYNSVRPGLEKPSLLNCIQTSKSL